MVCASALAVAGRPGCLAARSLSEGSLSPAGAEGCSQHGAPPCSGGHPVALTPNRLQSPPPKLPLPAWFAVRNLAFQSLACAVSFRAQGVYFTDLLIFLNAQRSQGLLVPSRSLRAALPCLPSWKPNNFIAVEAGGGGSGRCPAPDAPSSGS